MLNETFSYRRLMRNMRYINGSTLTGAVFLFIVAVSLTYLKRINVSNGGFDIKIRRKNHV